MGRQGGGLKGILRLPLSYQIGLAVERKSLLIATEPRLRIGCPAKIDVIRRGMIPAVDDGHGTALLGEIHLAVLALDIKIAVYKQCTSTERAPERLLTIEVELAMSIGSSPVQCIVRTLEVAVLIIGVFGTVERIEVQATDKAHLLGY